jgi:hypothetical protein
VAIEWDIAVGDHVTAPAHSMADAMGGAASKARGLNNEVHDLHNALGHASSGMHELHEHTNSLAGAWEVFEGSLAARVVEGAFEAIVDKGKELIETAIEASERVQHLTEVFGALSGVGEHGAEEMGKAIFEMTRQVAKGLPQSEAQIQSWTRSLMAAGVTDLSRIQNSLTAIAGAESLVEGGGEKVRGMLAKLNEASQKGTKVRFSVAQLAGTGVTEEELLKHLGMTPRAFELARKAGTVTGTQIADAMVAALGEKAAGPLAGQMGELSTITTKAKDVFLRLFESVNVKPLVEGIKQFFSVFDEANPSGRVVKDMIVGAFDAVFRVAGKVFEFLKSAFLHLMIWGLEVDIWLKPIIRHFREWFESVNGAHILMTALKGIGIVIGVLAVALGVVVAVGIAVTSAMTIAATAVIGFVAYLIGMVPKAGEALGDLVYKAVQAAKDFIGGFVDGIKNGVGLVVEAVKHMGSSAWNAIKGALGISSPSKLMFEAGLNVSRGMSGGISAGTPEVESASSGMVMAAVPRGGGGGGTSTITIGDIVVHVDGAYGKDAHEIGAAVAEVVEEKLASLMNRLSNMSGSAPVPA